MVQTFTATADANGQITVSFTSVTGSASLNGLELLSGTTPVLAINAGLLAGGTITINPTTFTNQGALQASNGGTLTLGSSWSGVAGHFIVNGGTLNLGSTFTTADLNLPNFSSVSGTVNLTGTLNNTGATLTLNATTGSWNLAGGTINGGTLAFADGQTLLMTASGSNRLVGVTVNGDLTLSQNSRRGAVQQRDLERHGAPDQQ